MPCKLAMHTHRHIVARLLVLGVALSALGTVQAQMSPSAASPAAKSKRSDPMDPKAAVPPLRHESALRGYRGSSDDPAVPWKEANDTVTGIGGWRAYAREVHQGGSSATPAQAPVQAPVQASQPPARPSAPAAAPASHSHGHPTPPERKQP